MHSVVILLDVWHNHPTVSRVTQTWKPDRHRTIWGLMKTLAWGRPSFSIIKKRDDTAKFYAAFQSIAPVFDSLHKAQLPLIQVWLSTEAEENKLPDRICCDLVRAINSNSLLLFPTPEIILSLWCASGCKSTPLWCYSFPIILPRSWIVFWLHLITRKREDRYILCCYNTT